MTSSAIPLKSGMIHVWAHSEVFTSMAIPTPYIRILVHLVYTVARYTSFRHLFKMHSVGIACNMRTACIMKMQATAASGHGDLIPQYSDLRRLPMCYQHILPLEVMKRYHCAVVGSAQGVLTVAIPNQRDTSLIETLTKLTGRPIFPVWVRPARMRLLIQRMECWEQRRNEMLRVPHFLSLFQIHTLALVLTDQMKEKN